MRAVLLLTIVGLSLPASANPFDALAAGGEVSFGLGTSGASAFQSKGETTAALPTVPPHPLLEQLGLKPPRPAAGDCAMSLFPKVSLVCTLSKNR